MVGRTVFLVAGVLLLASHGALAAGGQEAQVRAAKKACLLGDTKKGSEILADLYVDTNDATFIYNQGRCFEQNGQKEQAILRFEEYLRKDKNLPPEDADAVRKRIDSLQASVDHRGRPAQPEPAPATAPPLASPVAAPIASAIPPTAAPVPAAESPGILQTGLSPEPHESTPTYKRWWFWTGIGAVVAGGVVTAILLGSKSAPKSPACTTGVPCALSP